jgi:hypothetical protein
MAVHRTERAKDEADHPKEQDRFDGAPGVPAGKRPERSRRLFTAAASAGVRRWLVKTLTAKNREFAKMNSAVRNPGRVKTYLTLLKNFPSKCKTPSSASSAMFQ